MSRWRCNGARGKHQTVHRDARQAMAWLDSQPEVTKVILGPFKPGRGGGGRSKESMAFRNECETGVRFTIYTGEGLLEIHVLCAPPDRAGLIGRVARRWPQHADRAADPRRRPALAAA